MFHFNLARQVGPRGKGGHWDQGKGGSLGPGQGRKRSASSDAGAAAALLGVRACGLT
jgi:hypothetical protein